VAAQGKKLIEKVLSLSRTIRYCSIINDEGEVLDGGMRQGTKAMEPAEQEHKLMVQFAILMDADRDWDVYLGRTTYFLIHKSKLDLLLFPMKGAKGVLISTTSSLSPKKIAEIRKTVDGYASVR
jgi:hypothetical protein